MKRNIGRIALLLAISMLIGLVAGCDKATPAPTTVVTTTKGGGTTTPAATTEAVIPNFNATGYPICPEKVTLRVMMTSRAEMPADLNTIPLVQNDEKVMNVHIDWIQIPSEAWEETKNLRLATGDLPDIIESAVTAADLTKYGPDGTFIPMQDLIAKYAPNFVALYEELPELEKMIVASDGNTYGMGRVNSGPWMTTNGVGVINRAWLKKLGKIMPSTTDEFYEVLKAFKTGDPNGNGIADEIPVAFNKDLATNNGFSYLFASFGLAVGGQGFNASWADVKDGKVYCQATTDEYKEAVKFLAKLYAEGLMDVEGFTLTAADFQNKLNLEPGVVGYTQVWDINDIVSNATNKAALEYMPLLKSTVVDKPVFYKQPLPGTYRGWGVITKVCETPEVATRWLDYHFEVRNAIEHIEGPIGVRVLENADGTMYVRTPPEGMTVAEDRFSQCPAQILAMPPSAYKNILKLPSTDKKVAFVQTQCHPYADPDPMMPVYYSAEESNEMVQLQTDIRTYIERRLAQWIIDGKVEQEWASYLTEIDKAGLPKWLEINQAAYDRFME
ncbi:MAG: extracellular solute-binding protein [Clostridia bacterium]|nr:extracellular solute-binding protein [Clostridia bacterium]